MYLLIVLVLFCREYKYGTVVSGTGGVRGGVPGGIPGTQ